MPEQDLLESATLTVDLPNGEPHVLYKPSSEKHLQAHNSKVKNLLVYGNRGGGKSHWMRFDAHMRALSAEKCSLIIVRKTYPQLMQSHLKYIAAEMKLLKGEYNKSEHIAYYPNDSMLFFSHVSTEADSLNLLSAEFLAAYFDELSTIPWDFFIKLSASVRVKPNSGLTGVVRAATNPLGPSAAEVFSYFVNKDVEPEDDPDYNPEDWDAIKIQMEDNAEHLDIEDYKRRFAGMPDYLRKAWLDGEFSLENALFDFKKRTREGKEWHVISQMPYTNGKPIISETW